MDSENLCEKPKPKRKLDTYNESGDMLPSPVQMSKTPRLSVLPDALRVVDKVKSTKPSQPEVPNPNPRQNSHIAKSTPAPAKDDRAFETHLPLSGPFAHVNYLERKLEDSQVSSYRSSLIKRLKYVPHSVG